jgi:hypothetical protein
MSRFFKEGGKPKSIAGSLFEGRFDEEVNRKAWASQESGHTLKER